METISTYFSAFLNRRKKTIVYTTVSFLAGINVLSTSQVSHAAYPHPTDEVYVEHAASGQRINMYDRWNGGKVILHPKDDSIDQKLWIEKNPDNWTFSLWVDNTYARLSTQFTPTSDKTPTEVWMSGGKGDPMQTMRAIPREGYPGQYLLEFVVNGRATGQCLDVDGGAKYVRPHTWSCDHRNNNQGFVIISRKPSSDDQTSNNSKAENFFAWVNGERGIARYDTTNYKGQCVTLIARYVQEVYLPPNERSISRAYGDGYETARKLATEAPFNQYFGAYTNSGTPSRGAVISFGTTSNNPYGHVAIVMETQGRNVRLLESNVDSKAPNTTVTNQRWINLDRDNVMGWTNPQ